MRKPTGKDKMRRRGVIGLGARTQQEKSLSPFLSTRRLSYGPHEGFLHFARDEVERCR
jgi:hypothetical protein